MENKPQNLEEKLKKVEKSCKGIREYVEQISCENPLGPSGYMGYERKKVLDVCYDEASDIAALILDTQHGCSGYDRYLNWSRADSEIILYKEGKEIARSYPSRYKEIGELPKRYAIDYGIYDHYSSNADDLDHKYKEIKGVRLGDDNVCVTIASEYSERDIEFVLHGQKFSQELGSYKNKRAIRK